MTDPVVLFFILAFGIGGEVGYCRGHRIPVTVQEDSVREMATEDQSWRGQGMLKVLHGNSSSDLLGKRMKKELWVEVRLSLCWIN